MPPILEQIFVFIFGAVLGSFLNVCIVRLPKGLSVVVPRSHCPACGRFLRWHDNVPLLSFLWLRGRCAFCRRPIAWRYFIVELFAAWGALAIWFAFGRGPEFFVYFLLFFAPLLVLTFIDLEHQLLPNAITLPGIPLGAGVHLLFGGLPALAALEDSLLGILVGGGGLWVVSELYRLLRRREGIGGGDVKLAAMLGAFFGWQALLLILFLAAFSGSVVGGLRILLRGGGLQQPIPFGPFLAAAGVFYLFFGETLLWWYLNLW